MASPVVLTPGKSPCSTMNSLDPDCNELKKSYDACFNVWFAEKFLKGDRSDDMCKPIFLVYQDCVKVSRRRRRCSVAVHSPVRTRTLPLSGYS